MLMRRTETEPDAEYRNVTHRDVDVTALHRPVGVTLQYGVVLDQRCEILTRPVTRGTEVSALLLSASSYDGSDVATL